MSTKCTIAHDASFHFYQEVLDDDHVYLELRTTQFEAVCGHVVIPIPVHIWETIRHLGGVRLDLVDKDDSELLAMVEADVEERIAAHEAAKREHPAPLGAFQDMLVESGRLRPATQVAIAKLVPLARELLEMARRLWREY
jgi:hypothetical protein